MLQPAQVAVDAASQLIVAARLTQSASDQGELVGLVEQSKAVTGNKPKRLLADSGYKSEENFEELSKREIRGYVAMGREGGKKATAVEGEESKKMARRLAGKRGSALYRKRKAIVEPVFGWIKEAMGFRRFSVRGLEKVVAEWELVCLAANLKRLNGLMQWT